MLASGRKKGRALIGKLPRYGRWVVVIGALVGVGFFLRQVLHQDEDLYPAFMKGGGAAFLVMAVLGIAQPFWRGREATQAQAPGGAGVSFPEATHEAVDELNTRVTTQMNDVNKRLYDLEKSVFKPD